MIHMRSNPKFLPYHMHILVQTSWTTSPPYQYKIPTLPNDSLRETVEKSITFLEAKCTISCLLILLFHKLSSLPFRVQPDAVFLLNMLIPLIQLISFTPLDVLVVQRR